MIEKVMSFIGAIAIGVAIMLNVTALIASIKGNMETINIIGAALFALAVGLSFLYIAKETLDRILS